MLIVTSSFIAQLSRKFSAYSILYHFFFVFQDSSPPRQGTGQRATSRALPRGTEYFFICALKESFKQERKTAIVNDAFHLKFSWDIPF